MENMGFGWFVVREWVQVSWRGAMTPRKSVISSLIILLIFMA